MREESSEEEDENDGSTLLTPDVREILLIKRSLRALRFLMKIVEGHKSSTQGAPLEVMFVI